MSNVKRILMVAAENDALPGTKVGGVGDVLRDLPRALIKDGAAVDTIIPSYGFLARLDGLIHLGKMDVKFSGLQQQVEVLCLRGSDGNPDHYILHHAEFSKKGESVYYDDADGRPFASDASKFAFFSACVAQALVSELVPLPDVIHCHDWHTAFLIILIKFGQQYFKLKEIRTIFTIHNIAMQGIRPFSGDESSFCRWFPDLRYSLDKITDPRYTDCVNPMRAGVMLADRVHTVSPSYAVEILSASQHDLGLYGGDGLENDLKMRHDRGELSGILNGCEYPDKLATSPLAKTQLIRLMWDSVKLWASKDKYLSTAHWIAEKSLKAFEARKTQGIRIVSVGRLTEQKARILHTPLASGDSALQGILDALGPRGTYIMLGSGDDALESFMTELSARNTNFIFLNGYSNALSEALYDYGDLFLMPSSFEPCGISQMLAMRSGQPCLVNAVGGLKDTVSHLKTGFVFKGENASEQAEAMLILFKDVLDIFENDQAQYQKIASAAAECRFTWLESADHFLDELY